MLNRRISKLGLALAMAAIITPVSWGKSVKSNQVTETVKFSHPTMVNGTVVQPSTYRVVAKGDELRIEKLNHKFLAKNVLAKSPITWKRSDHTFSKTKMDIDRGVLTKVEMGGTHEAVLLHNS